MRMTDRWVTFLASLISFILVGLAYTLASFSYLHGTFAKQGALDKAEAGIRRVDDRLRADIKDINKKLDAILLKLK